MNEQDERDFVHLQRAISLPHLDLIEAPALPQPMLDRDERVGFEPISHRDACQPNHVLIGHDGVAVDADLRDGLDRRWLRRCAVGA